MLGFNKWRRKIKIFVSKIRGKNSNTIYNNLYDYHILEKSSMFFDQSKKILNKLKKIDKITWIAFSYNISTDKNPRISINLILTPLSFLKFLLLVITVILSTH